MHVVVGLGNPGPRYADTRHNVGFRAVERIARRYNILLSRNLGGAIYGDGTLGTGGPRILLVQPQQFMNCSGTPVAAIMSFYKLGADRLAVIYDDMDLAFGRLRLRVGGGHGGHNGIRDILRTVTDPFLRIKVGIGRPPAGWDPANYVLGGWTPNETAVMDTLLDGAVDAVNSWVTSGTERAMNTFNSFSVPG